jgi:CheY-like chemotaxis protein
LAVHLPAEPCALDVDATRFVQILSNLLHNAAKFTPSNGRIEVAAERREGSGSASDELVLTVSDTGVGIASDLLPHVFDLFAQGERLALQSHGGMGIGLSLARQLVEMHGGSIEATSAGPGCGSTFTLRLPIADAPASPDTSVAPSARGTTTRRRVLVIDDNADAAQMLAMLIRAMGGEARTATNGASGIRLARAFRPDLILLDIGMPGIDGYETCRRIRQESFGRSVCIVALTGWGQEKDKQQAGEAGFDLHLTKPADPLVLEHLLAGDPHADARHTVRLSRERS